jgi:amino acid adenylation domain-containing protein
VTHAAGKEPDRVNDHVCHENDGLDRELLLAFESLPAEQRDLIMMELARRRGLGAPIPLANRSEGLRASSAQEGLWFLEQVDPGSVAYVMPASVLLRGRLDVAVLGQCLTEIVRRHETLRTTFTTIDGRPYQVVADPAPVPLPVADLSALLRQDQDVALRALRRDEAGKPFDMAVEPGLRARLLITGADEHVLVLTMHHIVCDGWSLGVMLHEFSALYRAFSSKAPSPLADLAIQYGDFAEWQLDRVEHILDEHLEYWRRYLADAPVLKLPADQRRQAMPAAGGAAVPWRLEAETMARVRQCADSARATPFMVLLAAFAVLLWRWSGQRDLLIGYPTAGRAHPDLDPLIGYFVNTLPLRVDLADRLTFADLLEQVRADCTSGFEHQEVPFDQIVRKLHPDRRGGQVPFIQVMLALRDVPMPESRLGDDLTVESLGYETVSAKFDLCLDLVPDTEGGLDGRMEYRTGLFDEQTIESMMACFGVLLDGLISDPAAAVAAVPMMGRDQSRWLVSELAGTTAPAQGTLHGLVESRDDTGAEALAVLCGDSRISHPQLEERASLLAWSLRDRGRGGDDVVGICLPRSVETVIALLGVLKAGAAYALLDPESPRQRLSSMIAEARIQTVLTTVALAKSGALEAPSGIALDLLCVDDCEPGPGRRQSRPAAQVTGRHLASVTFVPDSAGGQKAAMNEHGALAVMVRGLRDILGLAPSDRLLAIPPAGCGACPGEIFAALAAGAAVVMPTDDEISDPARLLNLLSRQGVTVSISGPAVLTALVDYLHESHVPGSAAMPAARLRVAGVVGDTVPSDLPGELGRLIPGIQLVSLAGLAETASCTTSYAVPVNGYITRGRPLPGHRVYVLDDRLRPAPVGVAGALFIGGAGPGRGYLGRPSMTAACFVADPYAAEPGGRMYATGDRARFLADGNLEHLGRLDRQLLLRGVRVEPGEVEAVIAEHPAVLEAAVGSYQDPEIGQALVAYLTVRIDPPPPSAELRRFVAERLPAPMIPARLVIVDEFPRRSGGQLDWAGLPDPCDPSSTGEASYVEPEGAIERTLADLLAGVLEIEKVGALSDFFDLGGHSLQATQAVSRIREVFRVGLTIPDFLGARTVRQLAQELRELGMSSGVDVDDVAELIAEISAMPPDEAARLLAG